MNKTSTYLNHPLIRRLVGAGVTALSLTLAHAAPAYPDSRLTRAEVRDQLKEARARNTLTPAGEIGDTAEVLAARETLHALQAQVMTARRIEVQRVAGAQLALDELIAQLQALDAEEGTVDALSSGD